MNRSTTVEVFRTGEDVASAAAEQFVTLANDAVVDHGLFSVALAGGNTPSRTYELLASDSFRNRIDWSLVHLFFGDERCVPHSHKDSNYRMVHETLISVVQIPLRNVHPIAGEGDPLRTAKAYEDNLRSFFAGRQWPRFDLVLLGLGEDGHTASLFPRTSALAEKDAWVVSNWVEKFGSCRITLTAAAINGAANVTFVVVGAEKAPALAAVLSGPHDPERLPAQLIKPDNGLLRWLVDAAAASQLPRVDPVLNS